MPVVLLEPHCSLLHMTMARRQTGSPQRTGRKTTSASGGQKTVSGLSPRVLPQGKKSKSEYAKEVPEPKRNSNIIPSSNLLFNETLLQEKKTLQGFYSQEKNNTTTN